MKKFSLASNFQSPAALGRFFLTAAAGLGLDLWTKAYAFSHLAPPEAVVDSRPRVYPFIPGWIHFERTINHGAVFGLGQGRMALFIAVSIGAILFLTWLFAKSDHRRGYQIILGLLMAGVLGNMYDRVVFGYVRDMIHALPQWPSLFPWIFNVADSLLCVGVFLMVVYSFFSRPDAPAAAPAGGRDETAARPIQSPPRE